MGHTDRWTDRRQTDALRLLLGAAGVANKSDTSILRTLDAYYVCIALVLELLVSKLMYLFNRIDQ